MDKPPWADEVVEVTLEEADALFAMGHKVYYDYTASAGSWDSEPLWRSWQIQPSIMLTRYYPCATCFFYLPKESA